MTTNWIDIACFSILIIFFALGIWAGLIKTLVRIAAWIAAAAGVYYAPDIIGPFFSSNFDLSGTSLAITIRVLGFLIPFLSLQIIGYFLGKAVSKSSLSFANRLGGGLVGLVKGAIPCILILSAFHFLPIKGNLLTTRDHSICYSIYKQGLDLTGLGENNSFQKSATESITNKVSTIIEKKVKETADSTIRSAKKSIEGTARQKAKR